jgi:putative endonuclease
MAAGWVLYIIECRGGSLYTGVTNNLLRRLAAHANGRGARYTRSRLPVRLVYVKPCRGQRDALQKEYALKQLPRAAKLALVAGISAAQRIRLTKYRT